MYTIIIIACSYIDPCVFYSKVYIAVHLISTMLGVNLYTVKPFKCNMQLKKKGKCEHTV